jgi:hypothetical protein
VGGGRPALSELLRAGAGKPRLSWLRRDPHRPRFAAKGQANELFLGGTQGTTLSTKARALPYGFSQGHGLDHGVGQRQVLVMSKTSP